MHFVPLFQLISLSSLCLQNAPDLIHLAPTIPTTTRIHALTANIRCNGTIQLAPSTRTAPLARKLLLMRENSCFELDARRLLIDLCRILHFQVSARNLLDWLQ